VFEIKERRKKNKLIFSLFVYLLFLILICKFFNLQIICNKIYLSRSEQNRIREVIVEPARGLIYDRNGYLMVDNRPSFSVSVIPYEVGKSKTVIPFFINNNFLKPEVIENKIKKAGLRFDPIKLISQIDFEGISIFEENKLDLPGVLYQSEPKRYYPEGLRASHILGYIGEINEKEIEQSGKDYYKSGDIIGKEGLEKEYEGVLRGRKGYKYVQVDALGREIECNIPKREDVPPIQGENLYLTIDYSLQKYSEELLEGQNGSIVILNARNGEVLTLISKPDYDSNIFSKRLTPEEWKKFSDDPAHILMNRATDGEYSPGSTYKLILAIAALNENIITPSWSRTCPGYFRLGRRVFSCFRNNAHGNLNLLQAIERSCNVYFYQLGLLVGIDVWERYAKLFKFGQMSGIDLPEEKSGNVPDRKYMDNTYGEGGWTKGNMVNLSIGQGDLTVTPLQMAVFAMTIGNEGVCFKPHLVRYVEDNQTGVKITVEIKSDTISEVSQQVFKIVKEGMYMVVNGDNGTGRGAKIQGLDIAGKTGTAQNPHGKDHAWFIGFAPAQNPEIAFCVLIENGGVGGSVAAPIARKLLSHFFNKNKNIVSAVKN
jgi:penicillin-binding protein 2